MTIRVKYWTIVKKQLVLWKIISIFAYSSKINKSMWKFTKENFNLKEVKNRTGIYIFYCNEHSYIGSAKNLKRRLNEHKKTMMSYSHHNHTIQNCYNKYGIDAFSFEILEYCEQDVLIEREAFYIKLLKPDMNHILDPVNIVRDETYKQRLSKSKKRYFETHRPVNIKEVHQYSLSGDYIKSFSSITDAAKSIGVGVTAIAACCNNRVKTAYKFRWSFNKYDKLPELIKNIKTNSIYQLDSDKKLVAIWYKYSDISNQLKITSHTIQKYLDKDILYKNSYWTSTEPEDKCISSTLNPTLKEPLFPNNTSNSLKIYQYDLDGNFVKEYPSASEADRQFGAKSYGAAASAARKNNQYKTAYGYQWSYEKHDKIEPYINNSAKAKIKKVYVFDVLKSEVTSFNSIADAVRTITMYDDKFDSKCATFSTCCKLNTFFNKQFLVSYIDKFKLPKRHRFIIDTKITSYTPLMNLKKN